MRSVGVIKQDYEKDSINTICDAMRIWVWAAGDGLRSAAFGGDTPQRAYRLRRNLDLRW